jgi:site-specific DNA-methyltransferase (adenine-specific)
MNRRWIGIDITYLAINEVVDRLRTEKVEGRELNYELLGTPKDEDAAKALFQNTDKQSHKPFEQWAVTLVGGRYNDKMGADRGKDGIIQLWDDKQSYREGVIQVKGGTGLTLSQVRDFANVIESTKAVFGILITQKEPTKEMKLVAEGLGYADWPGQKKIPRYQILTTEGILERGETAIIPQSWLIGPDRGVGLKQLGQEAMEL